MDIRKPLAIACALFIIVALVLSKSRRRTYVLLVIYTLPIIDLYLTPASQGNFTVFDIVGYIAFIFLVKKFRFTTHTNVEYLIIFFLFSALLLLGTALSEFFSISIISFTQFFPIFVYAKALIEEINDDPAFTHTLIHAVRIVCLISVVFLLCQMVLGLSFTFYPGLNTNTYTSGNARYPSFFNDPQKYAQFLSMSSFLFLFRTNHPFETPKRRYILFLVVVVAMFLTGARAAFSGLVVGLALVFLIGESKFRVAGLAGGAVGYIIILLFGQYFPLFNREESYSDSYEFRNHIWQEAIQIINDNPLIGIGIGNYQSYVAIYSTDQFWFLPGGEIMYFDHPESGYLKMLTEFGIISFAVLCLFIIVPVFTAIWKYLNGWIDNRIFYFIGAITGWMISYITVYSLSDKRVLIPLTTHICLLMLANNRKLEVIYERKDEKRVRQIK